MCSLRDAANDLRAMGAEVVAISADDPATVAAFHRDQSLNFPLLSDARGRTIRAWGVVRDDGERAQRVTFVIDPAGHVRYVEPKVSPVGHGAQLVEVVKGLVAR